MFTSRPLADAQQQYAQTSPVSDQGESPRTARPQPIVDINLDEVPETDYAPFTFQLKGNVYTLGIDDDQVLFEIAELGMDEVSPNELFELFFERTYRNAVDENGDALSDGLGVLLKTIDPRPRDGSRPIPRQSLMRIMNIAVDGWMEELTDISMRPNRRSRRHRR